MTFAGTFLEDLDPVLKFGGLVGDALANALVRLALYHAEFCEIFTDSRKGPI